MQNENEKIVINAAEGTNEIVIRHGDAAKQLDPKAPLAVNINGTLNAVAEYLAKRINAEQFKQKDCIIIVNREKVSITLVFNERDAYNCGTVIGKLQIAPDFKTLHINDGLTLYCWQKWFEEYDFSKPLAIIHFTKFRY